MAYANIIYKSLYYVYNYNQIENNEKKLLEIVNKNKDYLKDSIHNYIEYLKYIFQI